jgi:prophage antirepressor-like protein
MEVLQNKELGLTLHSWQGKKKNEKVFVAAEIMKQLGYNGGRSTLSHANLEEGFDMIKITKKESPEFLKQLSTMNVLGHRTGSVIMLYESGVWKLVMQSKKQIGIQTRNWLAREVLPSIKEKGYYSTEESIKNPMSFLSKFTERNTQIENSKKVNTQIYLQGRNFSEVHNQIHQLVSGMSAKEIKAFYNSKDSARETLRKHLPENAATVAVIDELFYKKNMSIDAIAQTKIHETMPPAIKSLMECGINLLLNE